MGQVKHKELGSKSAAITQPHQFSLETSNQLFQLLSFSQFFFKYEFNGLKMA